ncbi:hypothetical protein SAMN05414139_09883 [Burkholderia sp. D7]|nr:hypothetical protein SAMN05414139_09883 [Burkholderia sp. D7]
MKIDPDLLRADAVAYRFKQTAGIGPGAIAYSCVYPTLTSMRRAERGYRAPH